MTIYRRNRHCVRIRKEGDRRRRERNGMVRVITVGSLLEVSQIMRCMIQIHVSV